MDRMKIFYLVLMAAAGFLTLSILYQTASRSIQPSVSRTSKQGVLAVGDEIAANFKIYNPSDDLRHYTYAVYLNDNKSFENSVTIKPKRDFVFGGRYRALEPGKIKVTAVVYEGEKEKPLKNISYYVTVKSK